jgi:hypothetical protein
VATERAHGGAADTPRPQPGEWDGPLYGELGVLETDGDRVVCLLCGRAFVHLGRHVVLTHRLPADHYRAIAGLRAGTGGAVHARVPAPLLAGLRPD